MIRCKKYQTNVMEFTKFQKAENITNEDFIVSVMNFEQKYLSKQNGITFHCLVRNLSGEFARLLFANDKDTLQEVRHGFEENEVAQNFMSHINSASIEVFHHQILKENFQVPENFACFEHGTFSPKEGSNFLETDLLSVSKQVENEYLNTFENSLGHFIGKISNERYSEIAFGKTLGKTREICFGYFGVTSGAKMLDMFNLETVELDFWYLIA